MTVKTESGEVYDLGAEADEVNLALKIMDKEKLFEPLMRRIYEIGVRETMKKYNIEDKEDGKE